MINSKQLIKETGISRATLNNYVTLGILPSPEIIANPKGAGRATRIGYFPDNAIEIVKNVHDLKKQGYSLSEVVTKLETQIMPLNYEEAPATLSDTIPTQGAKSTMNINTNEIKTEKSTLSLELSIDDFPGPAYMVNNNFELVWWNEEALDEVLCFQGGIPGELDARNFLTLLMNSLDSSLHNRVEEVLLPHLTAAKKVMSHQALIKLYSSLEHNTINLIDKIYQEAQEVDKEAIVHFPTSLLDSSGNALPANLFVCFFQEGILFSYSPFNFDDNYIISLLSQRNQVLSEILRQRKPYLSDVAVLVADVQNSVRICSELPAEEYFELINNIWQESEPIFRKYYGTYGKHAGDGMVYYFFPQPDTDYKTNAIKCALELKEMMRKVTSAWQSRKGWFEDVYLNTGIHEGQEWFGAFHAGTHVEFTVLGETINYAARISDFARDGSILTTKSMLNRFSSEERKQVAFGVTRRINNNEQMFIADTYASVSSLSQEKDEFNPKFRDIEMLPITEIRDFTEANNA